MKLSAAAVLSIALLAAPVFAQTADGPPPPAPGMHHDGPGMHHDGPGRGMEMGRIPAPVTNAPFSATYTSTANFTAPDGKSVQHQNTASVYRDSLGRTREDVTLPAHPPRRPKAAPGTTATGTTETPATPAVPHTVTVIFDPVANTITRLNAERKVAVVETVPADFFKRAADREAKQAAGATHHPDHATVTDLGSKTFAGVVASGKRTVRTLPARGEDAAATPKTITEEAWFSPDLKIEVSKTETGDHGTHADTLTALTKAEPAATLFKVPEGYTVQNAPPHGMHHGGRGPGNGPDAPPPPPAM